MQLLLRHTLDLLSFILTCLTLKTLFRLPYRATEGLLNSLMRLCGLNLPVPDHTHMSRRAASLTVAFDCYPASGNIDSTLRRRGEGEHAAGRGS